MSCAHEWKLHAEMTGYDINGDEPWIYGMYRAECRKCGKEVTEHWSCEGSELPESD